VEGWLGLADGPGAEGLPPGWLRAVLRFTRPEGSPVFGPRGRSTSRLKAIGACASRLGDPAMASVIGRWLTTPGLDPSAAPPLPSDARPDRPLAILRPDWTPSGDLLAVDHRDPGPTTRIEVAGRGRNWIGPAWTSPAIEGRIGRARPTHWATGAFVDCAEWTYRAGAGRVTRVVVLLRGRGLALLGQQDEGLGTTSEVRLTLPDGIEATSAEGSRSMVLSSGKGRPTARLIPLGLLPTGARADGGSIAVEGREVVVRQTGEGRRRWVPILISWSRAPTLWRPLTVGSRSRPCRPDVAAAVRLGWGRGDEGLVVYRSLAPPALRSFLGHQTTARFLVGSFTRSGDVRPILKVDA